MSCEIQPGQPASLNFIATRSSRGLLDIETLRAGPDLVAWVRRAAIVHNLDAVGPAELVGARAVREALHAAVRWAVDGQPLRDFELAVLNEAAAAGPPRLHLRTMPDPTRQPQRAAELRRSGGLAAVLSYLARDLLELLDSPDRHRLRWCGVVECRRPMLDRSRDGRRRWCGKACGDRTGIMDRRERGRAG